MQLIVTSALCLLAVPAWAAEPGSAPAPISTDRPDFTESTDTIRPGDFQLEGGLERGGHAMRSGLSRSLAGPQPLLRIGLTPRVELRLASAGVEHESPAEGGGPHTGNTDFSVGAKWRLVEERGWLPALSAITALSLPQGDGYFSSGAHDPILKLCWSHGLPGGWESGGNFNFRWNRGEDAGLERGVSVTAGHALGGGLRGFAEVYRIAPMEGDERAHLVASTGLARALGRDVQIDFAVGHTLGARTPAWVITFGFGIRGPIVPRLR
jgi:hypothetical protein